MVRYIFRIFGFFSLVITLNLLSAAESEIKVENPNKFFASKQLYCKSLDSLQKDNVYFILEKLTTKNINFWLDYYNSQYYASQDKSNPNRDKILTALGAFGKSLNLFQEMTSTLTRHEYSCYGFLIRLIKSCFGQKISDGQENFPYSVWIAYATREHPSALPNGANIEMVMSILLNSDAPITTHMGILRSDAFYKSENKPHLGLAVQLQAYGAKACHLIYGPKVYMVTRPSDNMTRILLNALPKKSLNSPGDRPGLKQKYSIKEPQSAHIIAPLDNRDPKNWKIAILNESKTDVENYVSFAKPAWFPSGDTPLEYEHLFLTNGCPSICVTEIFALSNFWDAPVEAI